jgi:transcriptional regulator with XRE-family HTH domain
MAEDHVTAGELATTSSLSERTIRYYRAGRGNGQYSPEKIAQLAIALGRDPDEWCSTLSLRLSAAQRERARQAVGSRADETGGAARAALETFDRSQVVKAGYFSQDCLTDFFRGHFLLLIALLDPDWQVDDQLLQSVPEALTQLKSGLQALMGMYEVPRRLRGVDFIPYPGLCTRLSIVQPAGEPPLSWADLAHKKKEGREILLITVEGETGDALMRGAFRYSHRSIHPVSTYNARELWRRLGEVRTQFPESAPAIIIDEYMARQIQRDQSAQLSGSGPNAPLFRLGVGVPRHTPEWRELVDRTQALMFINAPDQFIKLYVDLVERLEFQSLDDLSGIQVIDCSLIRFAHADVFSQLLTKEVAAIIETRLARQLPILEATGLHPRLHSKALADALNIPLTSSERSSAIATAIAQTWLNSSTAAPPDAVERRHLALQFAPRADDRKPNIHRVPS